MVRTPALLVLAVLGLSLAACQTNSVERQTAALTLPTENLAHRQMQGRRFETNSEAAVLAGSAAVLQDLGFILEESATRAGLVVGSKDRDAVKSGQVAGQIVLAALVAALVGRADPVWETNQRIRISIVTRKVEEQSVLARVTFQRVIWNTKNQISRVETIIEPQIYQEFFDKLAQSIFLQAHQI